MQESLQKYLIKFKKIRIDRSHGLAPHKPILLISVLQAFNNGLIQDQKIYITPELVALFKANWALLVTTNHDCRISYPFYYLKSDKFWKLAPKSGFDNIDKMGSIVKSFSNLNAAVEYALIDYDLFLLMKDQQCNEILTKILLNQFFPDTQINFYNSIGIKQNLLNDIEIKILKESSNKYRQEIRELLEKNDEEEIFLRGSLFKREIPKIYNNTCCISGMKIDATINVSMIDACHIVPFSISYDDTITNGIALCPNLHRAFDRGLISIDENYRVVVSKSFEEDKTSYSIRYFQSTEIRLPKMRSYHPLKENFRWHRDNVFKD